ncbi:BQ2448_6158 [Microbotryum intermedium]|uniref:Mitochondrial import inner membrane translocase subunit TIM50 n=1 Tax=Microbotryum intermedium TaxID=269621 RepID=A0A238FR89_9BASI|nr:BQ2448_6158 [Microbotryum intermedium]
MRRVSCASLFDTMAGKKGKGSSKSIRRQRQEATRMDPRSRAVEAGQSGRFDQDRTGVWQMQHQHQQQQHPPPQQHVPFAPHTRFYSNGLPIPPYAPIPSPPPQVNQTAYAPPFQTAWMGQPDVSDSNPLRAYSPHQFMIGGPVALNGGHYNPAFLPQLQGAFFGPTAPVWDQNQRWGAPYTPLPYTQNQPNYQSQQSMQQYPQSHPPSYQNAATSSAPGHDSGRSPRSNAHQRVRSPPAPSGPYVRPQRRVKQARDALPPEPTEAYLAIARESSSILPDSAPPPCIVLDLNNTLLFRKKRDASGSRSPIARPYLATFLSYLVSRAEGSPRWVLAVYSSARAKNVLTLLAAVGLVDHDRASAMQGGQVWEAEEGDALALVWSREKMGLTPKEFDLDVETTKDLDPLWRVMGGDLGPKRTVLLDDEMGKAATQPYNHLPIEPFLLDPASLPPTTPPPRSATLPRGSRAPSVELPRALATGIPSTHPCGEDEALLSTIYLLEQLRPQSNIAGFIRNGGLGRTEIVDEGKRIAWVRRFCQVQGIPITRDWDPGWLSSGARAETSN